MNRTKLFRISDYNRTKLFMSTKILNETTENGNSVKKLEHYRNLKAHQDKNAKPSGWDEALPFEKIPGPKPLPIIGNTWRFFLPKYGDFYNRDFFEVFKIMNKQYGDIFVLKGIPNRKPIVTLFNVKDFETLFRNEGIWPIRRGADVLAYYRNERKDLFHSSGLLTEHGEEWFKVRTTVNPILMQPRNIMQYVDKMNTVADELVDNIKYLSEQNENGEMPENFQNELYKWALESVCLVTTDKHLGCLKRNSEENTEAKQLITYVLNIFNLMYKLEVKPSLWKIISTPGWREYTKTMDFITQTNLKYINEAMDKLKSKQTDQCDTVTSVLEKLLKKDRDIAVTMSIDMLMAGVDTTGRVLAAALYYLARYPEKQQQLRNEAIKLLETKNSPITKEVLSKSPYLKAVIKEVLRLAPIAIGTLRTSVCDLVLSGYQIPKDTEVFTLNLLLCHSDEYYPRAMEFIPERWLSETNDELSHKNTNPFVYAPFGYGPRSCVGKRLATLELETAVLKIIRNFELKWNYEDMTFETTVVYGIGKPLKVQVTPFNH